MQGAPGLMASLLYGSGLRVLECAELRVKDLDFDRHEVTVHDGKGRKDRVTVLPVQMEAPLRSHLATIRTQHASDLRAGHGSVSLSDALDRKYPAPAANGIGSGSSPRRATTSTP